MRVIDTSINMHHVYSITAHDISFEASHSISRCQSQYAYDPSVLTSEDREAWKYLSRMNSRINIGIHNIQLQGTYNVAGIVSRTTMSCSEHGLIQWIID